MADQCIARGSNGICFRAEPEPEAEDLVISASVGAGGVNNKNDVRVIQGALNDVPASDGGPAPPLNVDGISGPLTSKAIANFQRRKLGFSDSRVDPNGPTLRALNVEGGGSAVAVRAAGAGVGPARPRREKGPNLLPNPLIVPVIESLLPEIRSTIRAAIFQLDLVQPHVGSQKQQLPQGNLLGGVRASLKLLDNVFGFFSFANPRPVHQRLRAAFFNMNVALNRSFETSPLASKTLFVPNTKEFMEKEAAAYTTPSGAFAGPRERNNLGLPNERIFFCSNLARENRDNMIMVTIHELAHYVSPRGDINDDHAKGRFFTNRSLFDSLQPRLKVRNAEHYAAYAFLCTGKRGGGLDSSVLEILRELLK